MKEFIELHQNGIPILFRVSNIAAIERNIIDCNSGKHLWVDEPYSVIKGLIYGTYRNSDDADDEIQHVGYDEAQCGREK